MLKVNKYMKRSHFVRVKYLLYNTNGHSHKMQNIAKILSNRSPKAGSVFCLRLQSEQISAKIIP